MTLDLTGIINENEFYSDHYLRAILDDDLKELFAKWEEGRAKGRRHPAEALQGLAKDYMRFRSDWEREPDAEDRRTLQESFFRELFERLALPAEPARHEGEDGQPLDVFTEIRHPDGRPALWALSLATPPNEVVDPFDIGLAGGPADLSLEELLSRHVFARAEPPRWVLAFDHALLLLLDRTKWNQKRLLRFDLAEVFGRRQPSTFRAMAALLHRDSLCPDDGLCLLDTLDESSHKHAFAVSDDLKFAAREAVERLGNEALYDLRERLHEKVYGREMARQLTEECLRYLYRLLFCFYVEARPELGYAPLKSEEYRTGYSLEALRDLELTSLTTQEAKEGYYLNDSLATLFRLVWDGFSPPQAALGVEGFDTRAFRLEPLQSHLFDPDRTPLIGRVKFRNEVLQRVIELLSLSRPGNGSKRGRISYAQLGINQLGAVYEGLLSYTGFLAEEVLYEVRPAGEAPSDLDNAWFVTAADLEKYTDDEKLFEGKLRRHPKGSFIYRLSGRNRQKSASYYTPEVLTRCVVKYALRELLEGKTADEILGLTVCEPALGSGAFLNEAVGQLADVYLERKQRETGRSLTPDQWALERQKVKAFLADNRVYGVDLNPTAIELAEVSLWLNTMYPGHAIPWFGNQLVVGDSLIGARRQAFEPEPAGKGTGYVFRGVPRRVPLSETRLPQTVWHFLVPDEGMGDVGDRVVKQLVPDRIKALRDWRKDFMRPFTAREVETLRRLSAAAEKLWLKHVEERRRLRDLTRNTFPLFGQDDNPAFAPPDRVLSTREKDRLFRQQFLSEDVRSSSPYRRLKMVMDYWCSLWFWPLESTGLLPSREEFLLEVALLLEGTASGVALVPAAEQGNLFPDGRPQEEMLRLTNEFGFVDVDSLCREVPRLKLASQVAASRRFLHWELEFAELFADCGGFDLVVGNPPWIKVEWDEGGVMGDYEPLFVLRSYSAPALAKLRHDTIAGRGGLREAYLEEHVGVAGTQAFLGSQQNYPLLTSSHTNLYKCFLPQAWALSNGSAMAGFLHPEGVYDDPKGGPFREEVYSRVRYHLQFQNEKALFPDVGNETLFSVNVYGPPQASPHFVHISNLFAPQTADSSLSDAGTGGCGGIKDDAGDWNLKGHRDRALTIRVDELGLFALLYDEPETPGLQARLPSVHNRQILAVLEKLGGYANRLKGIEQSTFSSTLWNETTSVADGVLCRNTCFPEAPGAWVLSGPHVYVANALSKTPQAVCNTNRSYDSIDLTAIPEDYLPRTNYAPSCDAAQYRERQPRIPWAEERVHTDLFRLAFRKMISHAGERTLIAAIVPPGTAHIDGLQSTAFERPSDLVSAAAVAASLVGDFFVKTTGRSNLHGTWLQLPLLQPAQELTVRIILTGCVTSHFRALWQELWKDSFCGDRWTKVDVRLNPERFTVLGREWTWRGALRTDYERRQALVEIDVLVARELRLTLDELCSIYRIQFPVLRQNEQDTWYDQTGRIVFTVSKGLPGVGVDRKRWEEIREMKEGTVARMITDDTQPGGPTERTITYVAPFDRCDREEDYATAWAAFERRGLSPRIR